MTATDLVIDVPLLERIVSMRRFEERTLEMAKRLFIHKHPPKRVASEFGVNLKRVYAIRKEFLAAAKEATLPCGWDQETFKGPKDVIAGLREFYEQAMAKAGAKLEEGRPHDAAISP